MQKARAPSRAPPSPSPSPHLGPQDLRPHADAAARALVVHGAIAVTARGDVALHVQPVDEELDAVGAHAVGAARLQLQRLEPLPKLVEEVHLVEAGEVDVDDADLVHAVV